MLLAVLIASAVVGRLSAVPVLALTWIIPAVVVGAGEGAAVQAVVLAPLSALAGLGVRALYERLASRVLTARA